MPIEDLFSDPLTSIGFALLANPNNPAQSVMAGMKSASDAKRQAKQDEIQNILLGIKMQNAMKPKLTVAQDALGNPILVDKDSGTYQNVNPMGSMPEPSMTGTQPPSGPSGASPSPYISPPNQKVINNVSEKVATKDIQKLNEVAEGARKRIDLYGQIEPALENIDTGMLTKEKSLVAQIPIVGNYFGGEDYAAKVQTADAPIQQLTKTYRVAGEGAASDLDVKILQRSAPSVEKQPAANKALIAGGRLQAERDIDYSNTIQSLFNQGMPLADAKALYKQYTDANPIFADEQGRSLNDQMVPFSDWYNSGMPKAAHRPNVARPSTSTTPQRGNIKFLGFE